MVCPRLWFAQNIQRFLQTGFVDICATEYPLHKENKWDAIDGKLIEKYPVFDNTKSLRSTRRDKVLLTAAPVALGPLLRDALF